MIEIAEIQEVAKQAWDNSYYINFSHESDYYHPPFNFGSLSLLSDINQDHGACLQTRCDFASNELIYNPYLYKEDFKKILVDFLTFGNCFIRILRNVFGEILGFKHLPCLNMRVAVKGNYIYLVKKNGELKKQKFKGSDVIHIKQYDTRQSIYGKPDYLGCFDSIHLNKEATVFRRKYYVNNTFMGYILYTNSAKVTKDAKEDIKARIKQAREDGGFKSMFLHIPNGDGTEIKVLPLGDSNIRDYFKDIKDVSSADILKSHRMPPILIGATPQASSSLGDISKASKFVRQMATKSLIENFLKINRHLDEDKQIKFQILEDIRNGNINE